MCIRDSLMTGTQNNIIKKYKREIRQLFPIFTQNEKRFFNDICNTISDYTESHADFTLESLIEEIGEPKDVVSRYLLDMDGEILRKSLFHTKFIRFALGILILLIVTIGGFKIRADYLALQEVRKAYIHQEVIETTILEEADTSSKKTNK